MTTGHKGIKDERPSSINSVANSDNYSDQERGTPDSEGRSLRSKFFFSFINKININNL
jgi:hypothetical protein